MRSTDAIRDEVLALPLADRARLARQILESLDHAPDPGAQKMWAEEVERRVAALEAGEAKTESTDMAFKRIEEQRRRDKD